MSALWENLLPGIHDDITLTHIATRLPWTAFHSLSSVSRNWQRAIQSHEVYGERIRSQSTETLVVVKHCNAEQPLHKIVISLYSMREKTFYRLPLIPEFPRGISYDSQFISVDGKLYVLGAHSPHEYKLDSQGDIYWLTQEDIWPAQEEAQERMPTYVLDLAGQRQWQSCGSVPEPERGYNFSIGCGHRTSRVDFVWGGCAEWFKSFWHVSDAVEAEWGVEEREWRVVESSRVPSRFPDAWQNRQLNFTVEGKNYCILMAPDTKRHEVYVDDFNPESSTPQHSISWDEIAIEGRVPQELDIQCPSMILPVNNELLARVLWTLTVDNGDQYWGSCLLQTKGFGSESKEIVWQLAPGSGKFHLDDVCAQSCFAMCPIQL